jgi:hypothetical protein
MLVCGSNYCEKAVTIINHKIEMIVPNAVAEWLKTKHHL